MKKVVSFVEFSRRKSLIAESTIEVTAFRWRLIQLDLEKLRNHLPVPGVIPDSFIVLTGLQVPDGNFHKFIAYFD